LETLDINKKKKMANNTCSCLIRLQLIMPSSLPKTKGDGVRYDNSAKSDEDEVLEVVPPTVPVLPFFSLPETPTITATATTGNTMSALRGSIIRSSGSGYQITGNGYQSTGNGYQSTGNGYQSTGNGYQSTGNGYQSTGNGYKSNDYQSAGKSFQSRGYGYQTCSNGYQSSNLCQNVAKNRLIGDSRGDGVVATGAVISCLVGDLRQSNNKNLRRCSGSTPSPTADNGKEFLFPAAESVSDENRPHHEQASE